MCDVDVVAVALTFGPTAIVELSSMVLSLLRLSVSVLTSITLSATHNVDLPQSTSQSISRLSARLRPLALA